MPSSFAQEAATRAADATLAVNVTATTLWVSPDAHRDVDAPIVAREPDPHGWTTALTVEEKRDLFNRVDSQLLLGEPVIVVEERGDWVSVVAPWQPSDKHPRGYPGWIPRAHLAAPPPSSELNAVVAVESAPIAGESTAETARIASYATILPVVEEEPERLRVALPGGRTGFLDRSACVLWGTGRTRPIGQEAILATARRFLGLSYLWAGMCAYGLDCSGLVHITFRALGMIVPRDGHDQAAAAKDIPVAEAGPGDLLFFAKPGKGIHHVGFATGVPDGLLHAPGTGREVVEELMRPDRKETLLPVAGRVVG